MTSTPGQFNRGRWQSSLLLAAALVATLIFLQVDGTLAAWTRAAISNTTNTAASGGFVVLRAASGQVTCRSDLDVSNTSACTSINVFGGIDSPIYPTQYRLIDVSFTNMGTMPGSSFSIVPKQCTSTATLTGLTPVNICTSGDMQVAFGCNPGTTAQPGQFWSDLRWTLRLPPTAAMTHTATGGELGVGATWTCRFHLELLASASQNSQGVQLSQEFEWVLRS